MRAPFRQEMMSKELSVELMSRAFSMSDEVANLMKREL